MGQGPYGTSGVCAYTEHPIIEGNARQEELIRRWQFDPTTAALIKLYNDAFEFELHYDNKDGGIDWQTTIEQEAGQVLKVCAHDLNGVCGFSIGFSAAGPGLGIRSSFDFIVNQHGDMAIYVSPGGGAYATTTIVDGGGGLSAFVIPHASVDDVKGWSIQFGFSAKDGVVGLGTETIFLKSRNQVFSGLSVSVVRPGVGVEIHGTATYAMPIYRSR